MENPFQGPSRWIMVKLSILGALLSSFVSPDSAADAIKDEQLSFLDYVCAIWYSMFTPAGAQALALSAIGGFVGLIYYTGTFFYKRWLFKKYGISKEHENEIKREG